MLILPRFLVFLEPLFLKTFFDRQMRTALSFLRLITILIEYQDVAGMPKPSSGWQVRIKNRKWSDLRLSKRQSGCSFSI